MAPDLNPLDFFLWGYLKDIVYSTNPDSIRDLKTEITKEVRAISPATIGHVFNNFKRRVSACLEQNGRHIEHTKFWDPEEDTFLHF